MEHTVANTKQTGHARDAELPGKPRAESASAMHPAQEMQQQAGNQAVQQLLRDKMLHAGLSVSRPDDPEEREADAVADRIMRSPEVVPDKTAETGAENSNSFQAGIDGILGSPGRPLDAAARAFFEPRFGRDFSHVRIHTGPEAAASAHSINANAYAAGSDIVFGHGEYAPDSAHGRALIAHELTHVAHDSHRPIAYRDPKDAGLEIDVPDPGPALAPQFKYPWQNPQLRQSIYPYRDEELEFFLRTYMEIDLEDPSTPVTPVTAEELTQEHTKLRTELADVAAALKDAKKAGDTAKIMELSARSHQLEVDMGYLPDAPKKGGISKGIEKKWTAYRYSRMDESGNELDHQALLSRILDRFDADKDFKRYPKWLRYMVFHFSGMRYQSAHGSYAPATELLKRLKREQLTFELSKAPETTIAEDSQTAVGELEAQLGAPGKVESKKEKGIKERLTALRGVEKEKDAAFSGKGQEGKRAVFEELTRLEDERDRLQSELEAQNIADPADADAKRKRLDEIKPLIEARESEIGTASLRPVRQRIESAKDKRRKALAVYEIERAQQAFSQLDDMQALAVIKQMHAKSALPEWVWREVVRVTALKLEATDSDWETVTVEEKKQKGSTDATTKKWKQIMDAWKADVTSWREKHGQDLSLVVIRAVCNEICEMSLHARGLKPEGGIAQKARWYAKGGTASSFSRPKKASDLKQGASLFFSRWSDVPPKDAISIVRSDLGVDLMSDESEVISDGFKGKNEKTYHFEADKSVTRTGPIESTKDPSIKPKEGSEFLVWFHEAMIVEVDSAAGRVITFETGPIGLRTRTLDKVVDRWNVYVGFAASTKEPADIDAYLKDILPGR